MFPLRKPRYLHSAGKRRSQRLIDEDRLPALCRLTELSQVLPRIQAFEQNAIHSRAEFRDRLNKLHSPLVSQLFRIPVNTLCTLFNLRTAALVSGNYPCARNVFG